MSKYTLLNPSGIYYPKHQTTAYDLALMAKEALKDPRFSEISGKVQYLRPKTNKNEQTTLLNTNKLLRRGPLYYDKALWGKTGRLSISGNNYVATARHDGRTLIVVLLKTEDRTEMFNDAIKAFKLAFGQSKVEKEYLPQGVQKFTLKVEGFSEPVEVALAEALKMDFYPAEEPAVKCLLTWDKVALPLDKDQKVGLVQIVDKNQRVLKESPVVANQTVKATWGYSFRRLFGF